MADRKGLRNKAVEHAGVIGGISVGAAATFIGIGFGALLLPGIGGAIGGVLGTALGAYGGYKGGDALREWVQTHVK